MEDYKEKYENLLHDIDIAIAGQKEGETKIVLQNIKERNTESEDDRIRKDIIAYMRYERKSTEEEIENRFIPWLEKQCEQKANEIHPIFRVGDYIRNKKTSDKVLIEQLDVKSKTYCYTSYDGAAEIHSDFPFSKQDEWELIGQKVVEQKPADKVEPKFKVDDWVVQGKMLYQIEKITDLPGNHFQYWTTDGVWFGDGTEAHLWTIQDAKDGDVLANENMVLIFKCFEEPSYRQHIIAHIGLDTCGRIQVTNEYWKLGLNGAKPATKEQRDLLFQKMKEAGYEWDAEKKELKEIEQKSAWSGEDSCRYDDICEILINLIHSPKSNVNKDVVEKDLDWLKSLKERVQPQPKQEWSEEDEKMFRSSRCYLNEFGNWLSSKNEEKSLSVYKACDWLKSLKERIKPQNTWKPSDEQMADLWNMVCNCRPADTQLLQDIYYGLKSLKE